MSECEVTKVNLPKFPPPELIVLTVEEARLAVRGLALGAFVTKDLDKEKQYQSLALDIEKRIEQTEGK